MSEAEPKHEGPARWTRGIVDVAFATDVGLVRPSNQDALFVAEPSRVDGPQGLLVAVADGMGGHQGGEVAASHVTKALAAYYDDVGPDSIEKGFKKLATETNRSLYRLSRQDPDLNGMGTTLTAAVIRNGTSVTLFHVGDSRAYRIRRNRMSLVTRDHSFVEEELAKGTLTPEEARTHPKRHVITRAFGTRPFLDVDTYNLDLEVGDDLLLCTDGLHGSVPEEQIVDVLAKGQTSDATVSDLLALARKQGGHDNTTVVLVRVRQPHSWLNRLLVELSRFWRR